MERGRTCTACEGYGWYFDKHKITYLRCAICKGSGRMKRSPQNDKWVPA